MTIFFAWDKLFDDDGLLCRFCKRICPPCPNPCSNPQSEESSPSTAIENENEGEDDDLLVSNSTSAADIPGLGRDGAIDEVKVINHYLNYCFMTSHYLISIALLSNIPQQILF